MSTEMSAIAPRGAPSVLDELERLAHCLVGTDRVLEVQARLARGMLVEALERTAGNYTHAAKLLGVQRQAIQQMVIRHGLTAWATNLRTRFETGDAPSNDPHWRSPSQGGLSRFPALVAK
jgi:hypothetical protein